MVSIQLLVVSVTLHLAASQSHFPKGFQFGASTSSYQIEGGWNIDGKGESLWDKYAHTKPENFYNNATGDIASDSYHQWREDVRLAKELGLHFYRFSISWPRILPNGFANEINWAGVRYYTNLIDALLEAGVEPVVTIYHYELPVAIQNLGGWTNPYIIDWFADYVKVIFAQYADRVKTWITINEPIFFCDYAYNFDNFNILLTEPVFGPYLCNKHVLLAHARAYRLYQEGYKEKYNGRVSISNYALWILPASANDGHLAELGRQHLLGRYAHAIFSKKGGWPPAIERLMSEVSLNEGHNRSRLPIFTEEEKEYIKGTADFFAMNYYSTNIIRSVNPNEEPGRWFIQGSRELKAILEATPGSYYGASRMVPVYPKGLRQQMQWIKQQYGDVEILITENGFSTTDDRDDHRRMVFIKDHLKQVLLAIKADNVSVIGYTYWSLIDSFEWLDGYRVKFGLCSVDFDDPNRTRTPRTSAQYYASIIKQNILLEPDHWISQHQKRMASTIQNGGQMSKNGALYAFTIVFIALHIASDLIKK